MPDEVSQSAMVEIKNGDAQQDFARAVHLAVANLESTAAGQPATGGTATETHSESAIASKQINSSQNSAQALEQDAPGEKFPLEMAVAETEFYTRFGGIFYLINAVNHPESYALLRDIRAWHELASGWTLIYGLAKQLTHQIDRPLLQFFADVCGFTSIAQLERVKHPELVELLFPCLQQRYENHLQWNEKLLALPARVVSTYSDINVFCDMSAIRLPVRLSGLDVNPGWIPWLGRVIRFHYREELALKLSGEHE